MVTIHIGFLVCLFLLFLFFGIIISFLLIIYLNRIPTVDNHREEILPITLEITNKFYSEEGREIPNTEESETVNFNVPMNLKDKKQHRVSNIVHAPNCKKIKIP